LYSIGLGQSGEWIYSLSLTLEELFVGKHLRFGITRSYLSNKTKNVIIELDIPAGCRPGTRILCRNIGHEWTPGVFQNIAFVIEEAPHDRFIRMFDDLIMEVRLPWVDSLRRQGGKVPFTGIDGRGLVIQVDYPTDKNMKGRSIVQGAGMPIRERGQVIGRGNLIVQCVIVFPVLFEPCLTNFKGGRSCLPKLKFCIL
jgi:DnaJ family protein B protein 4